MKRGSKYNFQRIYPYICKVCKQKRYTRFFDRRENETCTICRRKEIDKNQVPLFPEDQPVLGELEVKIGNEKN